MVAGESYLDPPRVLSAPGPEYADVCRRFQGIPGIERASTGRLWATWYGGGTGEDRFNYVLLATSFDGGISWSGPRLLIDPDGAGPVRAFDPCLWHDPAGRLWLFWAQGYEAHTDHRSGVWAVMTADSGLECPIWSLPQRICDGIMINKPTALSTGEWLLPVARWGREHSAGVVSTWDQGSSWRCLGRATVPDPGDRNADEHMIVERHDGTLWMLVRTNYGIGESFSADRGRTWSQVRKARIQHATSRFFVRRLRSGSLLLVKHGPIDRRTDRSDLTAFVSGDDGHSWSGGLLLDDRAGVSYPDGIEAADGTIYVIYDYDRTGAKEILMMTFTETDVVRRLPGPKFALRRTLINKATGGDPSAAK